MNSVDRTESVWLRSKTRAWPVIVASAALCLAMIGIRAEEARAQRQAAQVVPMGKPASGSANSVSVSGVPDSFAPVVARDLPAVVDLSASSVVRSPENPTFSASGSFFRPFFGSEFPFAFSFPRTLLEHSLGSGVIVKADGYILTNYHVVANAKDLRVILPDKREFQGRVLGTDPKTDLAVVKIDGRNLPFIPLADSSRERPGDLAFALGNPFGADETVNMGVVSSVTKRGAGIEGLEDFIQTDAAINAGNSGGALVNGCGQLIGINTAILFRDASIDRGVCFAVPSNMAQGVMDQIIKDGRVTRGWLGITTQPLTFELARSFGLSSRHGALISDVMPGGPAARGGLRTGDIITSFGGVPVTGGRELSLRVDTIPPGRQVNLRFYRKGQAQEARVTLGELGAGAHGNHPIEARLSSMPDLGLKVEPLKPEDKVDLDLAPTTEGILVGDVAQGSPAALAGVEPGDVIQEVNGKEVTEANAFRNALDSSQGKLVRLLIDRAGSHFFVALEEAARVSRLP